jgi:hypothetical protein
MKDIYDKMNVNGEIWYACGALKSKKWAEKHANPIKKAGGEYKIVETGNGEFQVFTNTKKFARMGTIFEGAENIEPDIIFEDRKKKTTKTKTKRKVCKCNK